ncbi:hypothetical protein ATZ36_15685 [Candidatus Endomicrobiellum trichonymphae]|uniref:Uncharacterized protein n=1 Tax=Endomicrobium trichonymphae TaxID=1408204 RepID=A0A1E5IL95_ENDTX|nr:hypothetical protein ATZ36_15685 [Candidatus Endomicrobium trichonymphae]
MPKLFSGNNKKFLLQIDKPERELNKSICENWKDLFQNYSFIANEFHLNGNVRSNLGTSGRIDIFGFNPKPKRFIIFELKNYDRNIADQVADYRGYIQNNFPMFTYLQLKNMAEYYQNPKI